MTSGPENPYGQPQDEPQDRPPGDPYGAPPAQPYGQPYGQPGYPPPAYAPEPPADSMALGAMITGIVALVLACGYGVGLLASPVALVLGRISMKRIDRSQGQLGGRGYAVAGFVLGIIGTVLLVLAIALVVVVIVVAARGGFDDGSSFDSATRALLAS